MSGKKIYAFTFLIVPESHESMHAEKCKQKSYQHKPQLCQIEAQQNQYVLTVYGGDQNSSSRLLYFLII